MKLLKKIKNINKTKSVQILINRNFFESEDKEKIMYLTHSMNQNRIMKNKNILIKIKKQKINIKFRNKKRLTYQNCC